MATQSITNGTRTSLTGVSGTLATGTYDDTAAYTIGAGVTDTIFEVAVTPGATPAGNKQVLVFVQESTDGTNFRTGPVSGTTTTDEPNLGPPALIIPVATASVLQRMSFSIVAFLGYKPVAAKLVLKNDAGQALAAVAIFTIDQVTTIA